MAKKNAAEKLSRRAASERLAKMEAVTDRHYAWGGRLCLHPFNLGFRLALRATAKSQI